MIWLFIFIANIQAKPCIKTPSKVISIEEFLSLEIVEEKEANTCPEEFSILDLSTVSNLEIDFLKYNGVGKEVTNINGRTIPQDVWQELLKSSLQEHAFQKVQIQNQNQTIKNEARLKKTIIIAVVILVSLMGIGLLVLFQRYRYLNSILERKSLEKGKETSKELQKFFEITQNFHEQNEKDEGEREDLEMKGKYEILEPDYDQNLRKLSEMEDSLYVEIEEYKRELEEKSKEIMELNKELKEQKIKIESVHVFSSPPSNQRHESSEKEATSTIPISYVENEERKQIHHQNNTFIQVFSPSTDAETQDKMNIFDNSFQDRYLSELNKGSYTEVLREHMLYFKAQPFSISPDFERNVEDVSKWLDDINKRLLNSNMDTPPFTHWKKFPDGKFPVEFMISSSSCNSVKIKQYGLFEKSSQRYIRAWRFEIILKSLNC